MFSENIGRFVGLGVKPTTKTRHRNYARQCNNFITDIASDARRPALLCLLRLLGLQYH